MPSSSCSVGGPGSLALMRAPICALSDGSGGVIICDVRLLLRLLLYVVLGISDALRVSHLYRQATNNCLRRVWANGTISSIGGACGAANQILGDWLPLGVATTRFWSMRSMVSDSLGGFVWVEGGVVRRVFANNTGEPSAGAD